MQLDFFPSRTLTTYLAKMFVMRIFAVLVMLVLVLLALDLLAATGKILAAPGNGQAEILQYASLRLPQLASRFLPYSVLLATLITGTSGKPCGAPPPVAKAIMLAPAAASRSMT